MRGIKNTSGTKRSRWNRWGGATVEMAVVSPLLLGLVFGIIEYGWVFMLQSSLTSATREACRAGTLPGATDAFIVQKFEEAVEGTGLTAASGGDVADGYHLQITRATGADHMETITVTVRVPWSKASLVGGGVLPNPKRLVTLFTTGGSAARSTDMVASSSMMREAS